MGKIRAMIKQIFLKEDDSEIKLLEKQLEETDKQLQLVCKEYDMVTSATHRFAKRAEALEDSFKNATLEPEDIDVLKKDVQDFLIVFDGLLKDSRHVEKEL